MKLNERLNQTIEQGKVIISAAPKFSASKFSTSESSETSVSEPSTSKLPAAPTSAPKFKVAKISTRFVERQGEIIDLTTHLTWSRCSIGQQWQREQGCVGKVRQYTYDQAVQRFAGNWRLPTRVELASLTVRNKNHQTDLSLIDGITFPDTDPNKLIYWSSDEENNSFAWAFLFAEGGIPAILYRSHRYAVRLVKQN